MAALEPRAEKILHEIVNEYITTGEPVGSRTVSRKGNVGLSAASVRNIMFDLTESGYITQPHVSAGRIPTDMGYRVYVNALMSSRPLPAKERDRIISALKAEPWGNRDLFKQSSVILAGVSKQAGLAAATSAVDQTFKTIEFIKLADGRVLVILVSSTGSVQSKIIYDENRIQQETLDRYSRQLNDHLKDLTLEEARERIQQEFVSERAQLDAVLLKTLRLCHLILSSYDSKEIFIDGQTNILDEPEFAHIEKLKAILLSFEDKGRLLGLLHKTLKMDGIQVLIGQEHGLDEFESCAVVAYPIRSEEKVIGGIGVIGPKRMNYRKVISVVDTTAQVITGLMKKSVENMS